jgi:hypothetical protein
VCVCVVGCGRVFGAGSRKKAARKRGGRQSGRRRSAESGQGCKRRSDSRADACAACSEKAGAVAAHAMERRTAHLLYRACPASA